MCTMGDSWKVCVCQMFDKALPLCFYGGLIKDCRVGLSGRLCSGDTVGVVVALLVGQWDLVFG